MKTITLTLFVCLAFWFPALADEASHRAAAAQLIEISKTEESMRLNFMNAVEPNIQTLEQAGLDEAVAAEVRETVTTWFKEEIKFGELQPKFVEVYMKAFTEPELKELIAFYQTPTGSKMLAKMPDIMEEAAVIGQAYVEAKQDGLQAKIQAILAKHIKKDE